MNVTEKIHQLLWNKRYVRIPEDIAPPNVEYVIIKDLTLEDRNLHSFVRKRELESARKQGVPTEAELVAEAKKVGLWTAEDDLVLSKADEHLAVLKADLAKQKSLARKKLLQLDIDQIEERKRSVISKKNEYYINSADYYAAEVAGYFLIRRVIFDIDEQPLFHTDSLLLHFKRSHLAFLIFLTNEVLSEGLMPMDEIREVARHPEWRLTWTLQRENLPGVFNKPVGDFNLNQKFLIYWSRVYDSAFESTEPPDIEIINDDDKFDEWLINKDLTNKEDSQARKLGLKDHQERLQLLDGEYVEVCNCGAKAKNVGKGLGEKMLHAATCLYGTYRRYTKQEREQIASQTYSRNSDRIRNLIDKEQQAIIENGIVEEQHLRGKKSRHLLGMKTDVVKL